MAESINIALEKTSGVTAVIENTAGQGSNLGYAFWHLAYIIDRVEDKSRVGVCLDTCHSFAAGYDLSTEQGCDEVFAEFEREVGFEYLRGMHLNDAMNEKDTAFRAYVASLATYWDLYYTLRSLTRYDFERNRLIEELVMD